MKTRARTAAIARSARSEKTQSTDTYSREKSENIEIALSKPKKNKKLGTHEYRKTKTQRKQSRLEKQNYVSTNQTETSKAVVLSEETSTASTDANEYSTEKGFVENENESGTKAGRETHVCISRLEYPRPEKIVEIRTISTFPTKRGYITSMVSNEPDRVWAVHNFGNIINCYTIDGKIENTLQLPVSVDDITKCPDGSLLLTEGCLSPGFGKSKIWKTDKDHTTSKPHEKISISPLFARGIFCKNADLYICCVDTNTAWRDATNIRHVTKVTDDGQILKTMDTDVLGEYLFTQPYRICVSKNGDIIVLDVQNVNQIKILSTSGQLTGSFPGSSGMSRNIVDVCCDCDGYIYVSDTIHNCIDMLYPDGTFCKTILTRRQGINAVQSIVMDSTGNLWVGNNSEIKVFKVIK